MLQREDRFDKSRYSRGRVRVPDVAFDRANRALFIEISPRRLRLI